MRHVRCYLHGAERLSQIKSAPQVVVLLFQITPRN